MESMTDASTRLAPRLGPFQAVTGTARVANHLVNSLRGFEQGRQVDA
jgi:hypothetical protein